MGKLFFGFLDRFLKRMELFKKAITNADEDAPFFPSGPVSKVFPERGVAAGKKLGIADCPSESVWNSVRQMFKPLY